jgi:hypothetical protein
MQVEAKSDCKARSNVGEVPAPRWLTILVILLLVLSGFSAAAEPNPKNVLVVLSALNREHEALDLMELTCGLMFRARSTSPLFTWITSD